MADGREEDGWRGWPPVPDVVAAARSGDETLVREILVAGMPKLMAFYRGLGLRHHDAEDVAAEAGEAVVRHLGRLRDPVTFEAWFWRIARSKFHDHLRRNHRSASPVLDPPTDRPEDSQVLSAEHESVRLAFASLAVRDRELLWMRDVRELEYRDIARQLRATEGSVRVAVMRARQRLQAALEAVEGEG